jgi:hypothetical protein
MISTKPDPLLVLTSKLSLRGMDIIRECGRIQERELHDGTGRSAIHSVREIVNEMSAILAEHNARGME